MSSGIKQDSERCEAERRKSRFIGIERQPAHWWILSYVLIDGFGFIWWGENGAVL